MSNEFKSPSSEVLVKKKTKESIPKLFKVILLNDDYTPMEYVVSLLKVVFNKSESQAVNIMLMVHNKGSGICGIFTKDIAETKVFTVLKMANHDQHPLKCIMEPE